MPDASLYRSVLPAVPWCRRVGRLLSPGLPLPGGGGPGRRPLGSQPLRGEVLPSFSPGWGTGGGHAGSSHHPGWQHRFQSRPEAVLTGLGQLAVSSCPGLPPTPAGLNLPFPPSNCHGRWERFLSAWLCLGCGFEAEGINGQILA